MPGSKDAGHELFWLISLQLDYRQYRKDSWPFIDWFTITAVFFMFFLEKSGSPLFTYARMYNILKSISA